MIRLSEENLNKLGNEENGNDCSTFETRHNQDNGNVVRNGKKFLDNDGNLSEDFDSGAVIVRSSSKQNRASPATDFGHNGVSKDPSLNGDTNIEAGCEILCLKFLSGLEGNNSSFQGTWISITILFSLFIFNYMYLNYKHNEQIFS